jgi:hypothetical protein
MFFFIDEVVEVIDHLVASRRPERGGAVLGPMGFPLVTHFVLDEKAATTEALFTPSSALAESVRDIETRTMLELKGILHSHPGLECLSGQDEMSLGRLLAVNPHLSSCIAPIVNSPGSTPLLGHEVALAHGKMSVFQLHRSRGSAPVVVPIETRVMPIVATMRKLAAGCGAVKWQLLGTTENFGTLTVDAILVGEDGPDLILGFPIGFPSLPPIVLKSHGDEVVAMDVTWRVDANTNERLQDIIVQASAAPTSRER